MAYQEMTKECCFMGKLSFTALLLSKKSRKIYEKLKICNRLKFQIVMAFQKQQKNTT